MIVASRNESWYGGGVGKSTLPEGEPPITIILALSDSAGGLFIGADTGGAESMQTGAIRVHDEHKLRKHDSLPLVWASSGNAPLGTEFDTWMREVTPPDTWEAFELTLRGEIAEINKAELDMVQKAGRPPGENDTIDVLITGRLNDKPKVLAFEWGSRPTPPLTNDFVAIGLGKRHAWISFLTLGHLNGPLPLDRCRIILAVVGRHTPGCELPADIWHITAQDQIEVIHDETTRAPAKGPVAGYLTRRAP